MSDGGAVPPAASTDVPGAARRVAPEEGSAGTGMGADTAGDVVDGAGAGKRGAGERGGGAGERGGGGPGGRVKELVARTRRVGVTTLAEFACRSGDLDAGGVVGPSAREGLLAHQRVQAASAAETEVRLSRRLLVDGEPIELVGRVDLLDRGRRTLGEIKSTLVPPERVPPSRRALHRAQLMLYGWLWLGEAEAGDGPPGLELVYVNLRGGSPVTESIETTVEELERHAGTALALWLRWRRGVERRRAALRVSAAALAFPHARFRDGQRTMSVAIYRCLRDGGALLCEAPTGTGKTISSLFPAVKALGEGRRRQVLYLTAKVSGRRSAADALARLAAGGLATSALTLRSRAAACFCERGRCERGADGRCPLTLGFHDRLPAAREELIEAGVIGDARLDECAWRHRLCPHALAAELRPWMDVVVCDYNHVFDPIARLAGLDEPAPRTALLVDEAHNLLARSRAMFSAALSRRETDAAADACARAHPSLARPMRALGESLRALARGRADGTHVLGPPPRGPLRRGADVLEALEAARADAVRPPPEALALGRALTRLATIAELHGDDHRTLLETRRRGRRREVELHLVCLDAAGELARRRASFGACVMFSATLAPLPFYRDGLGLPPGTPALALPSPFDPARTLHCVVPWVDTRWRARERSLDALVDLIVRVSESRAGNHLVFLPSYAYLERVHAAFALARPARETWRQLPGQDGRARRETLARLDEPGHRVGFAILGGAYGEGVDYAGERLIGVVVVGTGLPPPSLEGELAAARYRERGLDGFDHAARYPGFARVLQTAGRLIRGERDRGIVVLADDRFATAPYRRLFPAHWNVRRPAGPEALTALLARFWERAAEEAAPPSSLE